MSQLNAFWNYPTQGGTLRCTNRKLKRMRTKLFLVLAAVVTIAVGSVAYWFGTLLGWWNPLVRPRGVSGTAQYVFTWESAAWFDCSIDDLRNVNVCRAWDADGRLRAAGAFRLKGENRAATKLELRPSMLGASDDSGMARSIYLFGPGKVIMGQELVQVGQE